MPVCGARPCRWSRRSRRAAVAVVVLAVSALLGVLVPVVASSSPRVGRVVAQQQCGTDLATANPRLSVDRPVVAATGATTVRVTGTGYLTGKYRCDASKYGGVYLVFGWVDPAGAWGPSNRQSTSPRGQFGATYSYPGAGGSGETRDDGSGTVRLVSFTTGGTSGTETDFHMDAAGNWSSTITVLPSYSWSNILTGETRTVDCRTLQCGVYTIGAHGIASATNERFAPIAFAPASGAPNPGATGTGSGSQTGGPSAQAAPSAGDSGSANGAPGSASGRAQSGGSADGDAEVSGRTGSANADGSSSTEDGSGPDDQAAVGSGDEDAEGGAGGGEADGAGDGGGARERDVEQAVGTQRTSSTQVFDEPGVGSPMPWLASGLTFAVVLVAGILLVRRFGAAETGGAASGAPGAVPDESAQESTP